MAIKMKFVLGLGGISMATCLMAGIGNSMEKPDPKEYPYVPSLLQYKKSSAEFTPPATCGECHPQQYEEWTGSLHALAFKDPIYQGELNKAVKAVGHDIARQCEGCHTPAGVVTGEIKGSGISGLSDVAINGVSCDMCHSVSGHTGWQTPYHQPENGSLILSPGKDTPTGPVLTKFGPYKPKDGCGDGFHECVEQPLHKKAELCANCHQVNHYETHTPIESTYTEWKDSPYGVHGIACQDCHMVDFDTFLRSADTMKKPERGEYRHFFNGANFLIYSLTEQAAKKAGDAELAANVHKKYEMAVARLQAAADLEVSPVYHDKKLAEIKVRVRNIRAGHKLPTSLTNIRQIWLEMTVKDLDGKVIMTTGTVDAKSGALPAEARLFNSDGMGEGFHLSHDPWEIVSFGRQDAIPPKGYKEVYYGVSAPQAKGPLVVDIKLRYRQAEQKIAHTLLGAVPKDMDLAAIYGLTSMPDLPIVDMVSKSVKINPAL
ncbi:MAG: cytochrome c family protein [Desulfocapsaceae bacterium]|nr:cytochrome c family protein [Desulfocapsaceae bacterium]